MDAPNGFSMRQIGFVLMQFTTAELPLRESDFEPLRPKPGTRILKQPKHCSAWGIQKKLPSQHICLVLQSIVMALEFPILSESSLRAANQTLERMEMNRGVTERLDLFKEGLPEEVTDAHLQASDDFVGKIKAAISDFSDLRSGKFVATKYRGPEVLVAARIASGVSQRELAERVGLLEQQIQRYERERYRSINASTWYTIAKALSLKLSIEKQDEISMESNLKILPEHLSDISAFLTSEDPRFAARVQRLGRMHAVHDFVKRIVRETDSTVLLRRSLKSRSNKTDARASIWAARLQQVAKSRVETIKETFSPNMSDFSKFLPRLTTDPDPILALVSFLKGQGILFVYLPQVRGASIDGGATLVQGVPVVGVTARQDRLDNFWFTVFHECGHILLHHSKGLEGGFVDEIEGVGQDELDTVESEADNFAYGIVEPRDIWKRSLAFRANRSGESVVDGHARRLGVHPSILFGRLRYERNDYSLFSKRVGHGEVRNRLNDLREQGEV